MRYFITIVFLCISCPLIKGQSQTQPPMVIPNSPTARDFNRYLEIPVDYSTGVPDIHVPIHTIKSGKLEIPISLSYHASGIKVQDKASIIGLGWIINTGGLISRTVLGQNDDQNGFKGVYSTEQLMNSGYQDARNGNDGDRVNWMHSMDRYNRGVYESQSDRYTYSFPGGSGVFRRDYETNELKPVPYAPLKIIREAGGASFTITDVYGTKYLFKDAETAIHGGVTSWMLKRIESSDGKHALDLYYSYGEQYKERIFSHTLIIDAPDECAQLGTVSLDPNISDNYYNTLNLDSIVSEDSRVSFNYQNDRMDHRMTRLREISVYNKSNNELLKKFTLNHSYFGTVQNNNLRLRLDNVITSDQNSNLIEKYKFGYSSLELPPYPSTTSVTTKFYEDYWGYYNGIESDYLLPAEFVPDNYSFYRGNRTVNPETLHACILTDVYYPTGGRTNFQYSVNEVSSGLKVDKIKKYRSENDPSPLITTYQYNEVGSFQHILPELFTYNTQIYSRYPSSLDQNSWQYCHSFRNYYLSNTLYTVLTANGTPVMYTKISETQGDNTVNNGTTIYEYERPKFIDPEFLPSEPRFYGINSLDSGYYQPRLIKKTTGHLMIENFYNTVKSASFLTGFKVDATIEVLSSPNWMLESGDLAMMDYYFKFKATKAIQDVRFITETRETDFSMPTAPVIKKINYEYSNGEHLLLTSRRETTSNSETVYLFEYKYPHDFKQFQPYSDMVDNQHIWSPVIEEFKYFNNQNKVISSIKTDWKNWGNSIYAPEVVSTWNRIDEAYEPLIRYHSYNNRGNVLSLSKNGGAHISYLWGYKNEYPIAEVKNAIQSDIAYTSFESDGKGNWSYTGNVIMDNTSPTGNKSYNLSGGSITKALVTNKKYVVSYWQKNSIQPLIITGTQGSAKRGGTIKGWTYFEHIVSGITAITLSGSSIIDELRLYPIDSEMSTYTYEPLVGMTSSTDAKGHTTYYEYDGFQRLKSVKDNAGNILKSNAYHYRPSN